MDTKGVLALGVLVALLAPVTARAQEGDPYTIETMEEFNGGLKALWMDLRVEQIEVLTRGLGRASSRLHRQPFRWVAGDPRRNADGANLTYLIDRKGISAGLDPLQAEATLDKAMKTWGSDSCFKKSPLIKRTDTGADADVFDSLLGYGGLGDYRLADVVHAGWMPPSFFDAVNGPGSGDTILAFSVTFIFVDADGNPTDLNNDGYFDTATSEIYYNDGFSWLQGKPGSIDLESVALHEIGHSLGLGHIGPPLEAIMNPVYSGSRKLFSIDHAALCGIWGRWPS
ncbi:MAG: matrixin family metalloprotease [Acidobacteriota bacterium]